MKPSNRCLIALAILLAWPLPVDAAERHIMAPRVPDDQLESARAMTNPLPDSSEIVEKGKASTPARGDVSTVTARAGRATDRRRDSIPPRGTFITMDSGAIARKANSSG